MTPPTIDDENGSDMKKIITGAEVHDIKESMDMVIDSEVSLDSLEDDNDEDDESDMDCIKDSQLSCSGNNRNAKKWNINMERVGKMTFFKENQSSEKRKEKKENGEGKRKNKKKRV